MRIRIVRTPTLSAVDGVSLDAFEVGHCYQVGTLLGALFLAEGWAVPVALDHPPPAEPYGPDDPDSLTTLDRSSPPNLIKEHAPPFVERTTAADFRWRR